MYDFLITLFGISAVMAVATLLIYVCKGMLRKNFSAGCRYLLWLLIILRLCIPFTVLGMPSLINIPVSQTFFNETVPNNNVPTSTQPLNGNENDRVQTENTPVVPSVTEGENVSGGQEVTPESDKLGEESGYNGTPVQGGISDSQFQGGYDAPELNIESEIGANNGNTYIPTHPTTPDVPENGLSAVPEEKSVGFSALQIIFVIWSVGAFAFFVSDLVKYFAFLRPLKKSLTSSDDSLQKVYENTVRQKRMGAYPKLYLSEMVTSPMLVGIIKPMIVLPVLTLDDEAWEGIISHELTHYKRRDLWVKLASLVARALHWFNPMSHVAVKMMNEEMELSCDEKILKNVSEENRLKYGTVMVDILRNCKGRVNAFSTHFNPNKNTAKGRIMNILDVTKKRRGISLVCLCLVLCIVSGSVFGCVSNSEKNNNDINNIGEGITNKDDDDTKTELKGEKIDYHYEYSRIENIENGDSAIFEPIANVENLSKTPIAIYKFMTFGDFGSYIGNYTERAKYDSTDWVSDLPYYGQNARDSKYNYGFFGNNCLIVVQTKEAADKRYVISDLKKDGKSLNIELYPVEYESDTAGYTCQFYLIEVKKSDIRDVTDFSAVVFEPTDSYDDKLLYSKEAEKVTWDYPTDKTKVEKNEKGEYKSIEFYTNDQNWRLYYEIGGPYLTLTNGKVSYTFDDARNGRNPTYDTMFFPVNGEKSAAAIISPDGRYAAVLYDKLTLVYGQYKSISMRVIDLITGQTIVTNYGNYEYIFSSNGLSSKYLNSYLPIEGYTKELFYMDTSAEFIDRDTLVIHRQLVTEDGNIRLYDRLEYNIGQPSGKDFDSYGEYIGILNDDVKEKNRLDYSFIEYSPKEPADSITDWSDSTDLSGYSIKLNVPTGWEYQGGRYCLPNSSVGVECWHVFSVDKNYIFKDDFLDYASPDRRYTEESPHNLVTFPHNLKEWEIVRGTTAQGYDYISYGSKFYIRVTDELVWTVEFMSGVPKEAYELKNAIIDSVVLVKKESEQFATSLDEIDSLNVDENLKKMAKALLTNDTATMEKLAYCKAGTYNEYKKVKFGSFTLKVTNTANKRIEITVEVENVPEVLSFADDGGTALFYISLGMNGINLSDPTVVNNIKTDMEFYRQEPYFLAGWFNTPTFDYDIKQAAFIDPGEISTYSKWLYDFLYNYVKSSANKSDSYTDREIADMCKAYATEMFGLTDHTGYNSVFRENESGELVYANGHGGKIASYIIEGYNLFDENGIQTDDESKYSYSETYILVFADPGKTVMSKRIKYTVTPGEVFPKSFTYEVVDDSPYSPYSGFQV